MTDPSRRSDAQRYRDRLLDAAGELMEADGPNFTLPELARRAGVGTATAYRHFADIDQVHTGFETRSVAGFVQALREIDATPDHPIEWFRKVCDCWAERGITVAAPARFVRSATGFLDRLGHADPAMSAVAGTLRAVLQALIGARIVPDQDEDAALLLWITLFDERVVVDLARAHGWTSRRISDYLGTAVLGALGSPAG